MEVSLPQQPRRRFPPWKPTASQRARHRRDLLWLTGLIIGLSTPVAVGVFIVFNLTCMRNPNLGMQSNMFHVGNYDLWQTY